MANSKRGAGTKNYWAAMTQEQRSAEIRRRHKVAQAKKAKAARAERSQEAVTRALAPPRVQSTGGGPESNGSKKVSRRVASQLLAGYTVAQLVRVLGTIAESNGLPREEFVENVREALGFVLSDASQVTAMVRAGLTSLTS